MTLVNGTIPSFINGVSQQPLNMRLPSQGTVQENGVSSPADGLGKRQPTEHIARLFDEVSQWPKVHWINRDEYEKYVIVFHDGKPRVYDLAGKRFPVYADLGVYDYLTCKRPTFDLTCLTLADETIVVNRGVNVRIDKTKGHARVTPSAMIWVRAGNYGSRYAVTINGHATYHIETSTTDVTQIATDRIAADLAEELSDGLNPQDWRVRYREGDSVIWIYRIDGGSFRIEGSDSQSGSSLTVFKDTIDRFSDLPPVAPNGMVVKVQGDPDSDADDYWVRFDATNGEDGVWPGRWTECARPDTKKAMSPSTLPHRLVRKQDDTAGSITGNANAVFFLFEPIPFTDRLVGDDDSAPFPSFLNEPIKDVFLFRNRLGFTSGPNVVLSRSGDYFNFFRSTLLGVQDNDPIDLTLSHARVSSFNFALPFAGELLLFADRTQASLRGGDTLTPKSVSLTVVSEYESSKLCPPIPSHNSVFIPFDNGEWGGVREYYIEGSSGQRTADSISSHIPRYFRNPAIAAASSVQSLLLVMDERTRNRLYVYKWFMNGQDRLQSSWSEWIMGDKRIFGFEFINDFLYLVIERECGQYLERIDLNRLTDFHSAYTTHLDRRLNETQVVVRYEPATGRSIITLPYRSDTDPVVVIRADGDEPEGREVIIDNAYHFCDPYRYVDTTLPPLPPSPPVPPVVVPPDTPTPPVVITPPGDGGPPPDPGTICGSCTFSAGSKLSFNYTRTGDGKFGHYFGNNWAFNPANCQFHGSHTLETGNIGESPTNTSTIEAFAYFDDGFWFIDISGIPGNCSGSSYTDEHLPECSIVVSS